MRVLLLCTGLKMGGAEQQVAALGRQFLAEGHAVAIVSLTSGQEVKTPGAAIVHSLNMHKGIISTLSALWRLRRFVKTWRPDVIHAHMVHANLVVRALAALTGVPPVICSAHSAREGGRVRMLAYRMTDRWCSLTTHVSEAGRQAMIAAGAVPASRVCVMPNGIDTSRFRIDPPARDKTRAALGLGPHTRMAINVGRLVSEKAQDALVDAFARVIASNGHLDIRLFIVGEGVEHARLAKQIDRLGLTHSVTMLGLRHDVPALLAAADTFVLSSNVEGMPLVIGEALSTGCPVVATDAAGVRELLGPCGTIVKCGDTRLLAAAMASACAAGRGTETEQQVRRQWVTENFGLEAVARQWIACYQALAATSGDKVLPKVAR
ncbi:glycosyltransferase [Cupriavidus pauculus]|uniref:glycosyltransferase n=1 Tax=Cupriavidus pauculus TaxID=82633 RepID=UPI001D0C6FFA|nr:glycosyltransferase [Cupriavidus pauculus]